MVFQRRRASSELVRFSVRPLRHPRQRLGVSPGLLELELYGCPDQRQRLDDRRLQLRGGSWDNGGQGLRSAYRFRGSRDFRNDLIGFRVARSVAL